MKVVFLDIDGVVNNPYIDADLKVKYFTEYDGRVSNVQAIRWLSRLCLETDAVIVISSTWRHAGIDNVRNCLYNSGLDPEVTIYDTTPNSWGDRGDEIALWLKVHPEVDKFVILDDDNDMGQLLSHLVQCDSSKGFLEKEYQQAKSLLSGTLLL